MTSTSRTTTYEECEQVRDILAEALLDGVTCGAVGLGRNEPRDWIVKVMCNKDEIELPKLPKDLAHVEVVQVQSSPFKAHGRMR